MLSNSEQLNEQQQKVLLGDIANNTDDITKSLDEVIKHNDEKNESIQKLDDFDNNKSCTEHINNLRNSVSGSNEDINNLKEKINALIQEISFLKNLKSEDGNESTNSFIEYNPVNEENKKQAIAQIKLLQTNNTEQRNFIVKLRNEISSLEQETHSSSDLSEEEIREKSNEIDQLERIVTEFEHCIYALESEIDLLNNQLSSLGRSNNPNQENISSEQGATDNAEIAQLTALLDQTMQLYSDQSLLSELATEAAKCEKMIDLLIVINNSFISLGVTCAFYIKTEISNNKSIPDGFLSKAEEELLRKTELNKKGNQFSIATKMFYWDKYC